MNWMCLTEVWLAIALFVALRCWYRICMPWKGARKTRRAMTNRNGKDARHHLIARGDRPAAVRPAPWDSGPSHLSHNSLWKWERSIELFLLAFFLYNDVFLKCDHENAIREDHAYGHVNVSTSKLRAMSVLYAPHVFFFFFDWKNS